MIFNLLISLFNLFSSQRKILLIFTSLLTIVSIILFSRIKIDQSIEAMLPDNDPVLAKEFALLQKSPFLQKIFINLRRDEQTDIEALIQVADKLAAAMRPPFFNKVITGPQQEDGPDFIVWLLQNLPELITEEDVREIQNRISDEYIESAIRNDYLTLLSPKGWGLKKIIQIDPLNLRNILWHKFSFLRVIPEMQIKDNHFVSADEKNLLIIAETPIKITDLVGSARLLAHFQNLIKNIVPPSIKVAMLSGHRYSVANANIIQHDIKVALLLSFLGLVIIFFLFLRSWRGLLVLLVPGFVLCFAGATLSLLYDRISGLTLAFGSVLAGIAIDYALHVFFAFSADNNLNAKEILTRIVRPVFYSALTSITAFATLFVSGLPVLRQLSLFSIIGLVFALLIALVILPHFMSGKQNNFFSFFQSGCVKYPFYGRWIGFIWIVLLVFCVWQAFQLDFNANLHSLNYASDEICKDEALIKKTWGNTRDRAFIFVSAFDLQKALELNDMVFANLKKVANQMVSLAPFLPSIKTQRLNYERWHNFWSGQQPIILRQKIKNVAQKYGFSERAFNQFYNLLKKNFSPLTPAIFRKFALKDMYDLLVVNDPDEFLIMTLIPDSPLLKQALSAVQSKSVYLVSSSSFQKKLSRAIKEDFLKFLLLAFLMVIFLLVVLFKDLTNVFLAMIPVVTGLAIICAGMRILSMDFNLMNIISIPLIIGLGADYGIFMVCKLGDKACSTISHAVLVSGLTTIAGFGALALAGHPAMYSIGVTVLLGISGAVLSALFVIPALYRR